eukprot:Nitzschia sp. Nitz4//scaffold278_size24532//1937//3295//NITZ4_008371-RA/size24532-processed-gene-0.6-mRNA-1//-1//CDS//3329545363//6418//frame0
MMTSLRPRAVSVLQKAPSLNTNFSNHLPTCILPFTGNPPQSQPQPQQQQQRFFSNKKSSSKKNKRGGRHYAHKLNEKKAIQRAKNEKTRERKKRTEYLRSLPDDLQEIDAPQQVVDPEPEPPKVPPLMMLPTGSPHVYVARTAFSAEHDTSLLFDQYQRLPALYEQARFEYFPPKVFDFEFPTAGVPEVAVLGRSNVGKSTLVNALMRRSLAKTSKSPGRTQLPYYYGLIPNSVYAGKRAIDASPSSLNNNHELDSATLSSLAQVGGPVSRGNKKRSIVGYLVDLPGYGFGTAPKEVVEGWQGKTQEWLIDRRDAGTLKRLFILLDARRGIDSDSNRAQVGPATTVDQTVLEWAEEAEIPYSIVITKADRVSVPQMIKQINDLCLRYSSRLALSDEGTVQSPVIHVTSSRAKWGVHELLESIEAEFVADDEEEEYEYDRMEIPDLDIDFRRE